MLLETKKIAEDKAKAFTASRAMLELATKEGKDFTPEQEVEYKAHLDEYKSLDKKIKLIEASNELSLEQKDTLSEVAQEQSKSVDEATDTEEKYSKAFNNYLRKGKEGISSEERNVLETRAQSVGTDSQGGFTVPQAFSNELEKALLAFGGLRSIARVITRGDGAPLDWPTVNGTANQGNWLAENATAAETDEVFANVTFGAFTGTSDLVKVSNQLMMDSAFPMDTFLAEQLGERIGRLQADAWINGTGSGQPTGVKDAAGTTGAAGAAVIAFDDIIKLKHSLDPAYRARNASFVFNDTTLEAITKLKDDHGNYLWRPSLEAGAPDMIVGHKYVVDQAMPNIATAKRSVLFGDFSKYIIMDIQGINVKRLNELLAVSNQTGFIAFARTDGQLVDGGTNPVKALLHP